MPHEPDRRPGVHSDDPIPEEITLTELEPPCTLGSMPVVGLDDLDTARMVLAEGGGVGIDFTAPVIVDGDSDLDYAIKRAEALGLGDEATGLRRVAVGLGSGLSLSLAAGAMMGRPDIDHRLGGLFFNRPINAPPVPMAPRTIRTEDGRVHEVRSLRAAPKNKAGMIQVAPGLWMRKPKPKPFKGSKAAKKASRRRR